MAGTREHDTSDEEHFSDATEGSKEGNPTIPTTRIEKTDGEPSHGEVPGTAAYEMRTQDASPDEVTIMPEEEENTGPPIPQTIIEKVEPDRPSHGEVPGTAAYDMRTADAAPDVVVQAPAVNSTELEDIPTHSDDRHSRGHELEQVDAIQDIGSQDDDQFDDEFDEFDGGAELDDDFGAFDDGDDQKEQYLTEEVERASISTFPVMNFEGYGGRGEIIEASVGHVKAIFGLPKESREMPKLPSVSTSLLNERSESLWAQLVEPPPLQPPNWVRSRIRRLFLVSLGVPVDLDEILPASKQKKLVLPALEAARAAAPAGESRASDERGSREPGSNRSNTPTTSTSTKAERRRKGVALPPEVDLNSARLLCTTTDTALHNLTVRELRDRVTELEELTAKASEVLQYWLTQRNSASGDKEAFEEVIENLVKHAKKIRK